MRSLADNQWSPAYNHPQTNDIISIRCIQRTLCGNTSILLRYDAPMPSYEQLGVFNSPKPEQDRQIMFQIIEKKLLIDFPTRRHLHVLSCQIPNYLEREKLIYRLANPEQNWQTISSIIDLIIEGQGNLKKINFIFFPESVLPLHDLPEMLERLNQVRLNTITTIGLGPISLGNYLKLLQQFSGDNQEALASVREDLDTGDIETLPVNCCATIVKENDGNQRVFFAAKSHPFGGEETLDSDHYLYRGKIFPFFRCQPSCFNFMTLICLDYAYRDIYQSNISVVIEKANQLFFETRQKLDLLAVIECNPKPDHSAFGDVARGFYGEYLARAPGVSDTVTLFCNTSEETISPDHTPELSYGHSSVLIHKNHKLKPIQMSEYSIDNFNGRPLGRLRFNAATQLHYFSLPFFHELDPRSTRTPLKVHAIFRPEKEKWIRINSDELANNSPTPQPGVGHARISPNFNLFKDPRSLATISVQCR